MGGGPPKATPSHTEHGLQEGWLGTCDHLGSLHNPDKMPGSLGQKHEGGVKVGEEAGITQPSTSSAWCSFYSTPAPTWILPRGSGNLIGSWCGGAYSKACMPQSSWTRE